MHGSHLHENSTSAITGQVFHALAFPTVSGRTPMEEAHSKNNFELMDLLKTYGAEASESMINYIQQKREEKRRKEEEESRKKKEEEAKLRAKAERMKKEADARNRILMMEENKI
jgi:hypothetical protein